MIKGSIPALVTPFKNGELDLVTLKKLVEWHIAEGSTGLVPVGTTGESPTLSHDEHQKVIEVVVQTAAGRVPVIAGAGSNNTSEGISLIRFAEKVGADAALVVTPYYNKPNPSRAGGAFHRPARLLQSADRDLQHPRPLGRGYVARHHGPTGETAAHHRCQRRHRQDRARQPMQRATCGADFIQLSGEDATALGFNAHGGVGCISVTANVAPRLCAEFQAATLAGDYAKALAYQDKLMPLHEAIFIEPGLVGAKYGLSLLGLCTEDVRLPLVGLTDPTKARIKAAMQHAGLI